jgi:sugar lactone lactonase YvrE
MQGVPPARTRILRAVNDAAWQTQQCASYHRQNGTIFLLEASAFIGDWAGFALVPSSSFTDWESSMLSINMRFRACRLFACLLALTNMLPATLDAAPLSDPPAVVTTLAGTAGVCGDTDGSRTVARFCGPEGIAVDKAGNLYVTSGQTVRKLTPDGAVTTLAGTSMLAGYADGAGPAAQFLSLSGIAAARDGNLYVADGGNHSIRKITATGLVTTLAGNFRVDNPPGSKDGIGTAALFNNPKGIATDRNGNLYVTDTANNNIRRITLAGLVTTIAGTAGHTGSADGTGAAARFNQPTGIAVDKAGNLYVTDTGNQTIRKITPDGKVSTLAGTALVAGSADGTGPAAVFNGPTGIAVDRAGNLYVTDTFNNTIRKITAAGVVTTLAGNERHFGAAGSSDGIGTAALFNAPRGIAIDRAGLVYVADTGNHTIRMITIGQIHAFGKDDRSLLDDNKDEGNDHQNGTGGCIVCSPFSR